MLTLQTPVGIALGALRPPGHPASQSDGRGEVSFSAAAEAPSCSSNHTARAPPLRSSFLPPSSKFSHKGCKITSRVCTNPSSTVLVVASAARVNFTDVAIPPKRQLPEESSAPKPEPEEFLACPVCYSRLKRIGDPGLTIRAIARSGFQCPTCLKTYSSRYEYLDLTVTASAKTYSEVQETGTELFRSPLVSYAYERGWRQNFRTSGFPGPDEEVKLAQEYLKSTFGGILLDVSCGSGLFTRRFAKLGLYASVIAVDFSENMLRQTYDYIKEEPWLLERSIALVRADVARLPFLAGSVDAIHAGAALHCWPSPAAGMAEICRVLRPGGVFVGTTFLIRTPPSPLRGLAGIGQLFQERQPSSRFRYWREPELLDLMRVCGFVNVQSTKRGGFIMLSGQKPEAAI